MILCAPIDYKLHSYLKALGSEIKLCHFFLVKVKITHSSGFATRKLSHRVCNMKIKLSHRVCNMKIESSGLQHKN